MQDWALYGMTNLQACDGRRGRCQGWHTFSESVLSWHHGITEASLRFGTVPHSSGRMQVNAQVQVQMQLQDVVDQIQARSLAAGPYTDWLSNSSRFRDTPCWVGRPRVEIPVITDLRYPPHHCEQCTCICGVVVPPVKSGNVCGERRRSITRMA